MARSSGSSRCMPWPMERRRASGARGAAASPLRDSSLPWEVTLSRRARWMARDAARCSAAASTSRWDT